MKRFLAFFLVVLMLMPTCFASFVATSDTFPEAGTCYVEIETEVISTGGGPRGGRKATKEQIEAAAKIHDTGISETQREAARQKLGLSNSTRATWTYLDGYIVYSQSTAANCGPAAIQAALKYINGYTPSQSEIAYRCHTVQRGESYLDLDMGTHIYDMVNYINTQQSERTYVPQYRYTSSSGLGTDLFDAITIYEVPPIIGLAFDEEDGWFYDTGGHIMSVYGGMDDESRFALADPWIGYSGSGLAGDGIGWSYAKPYSLILAAFESTEIGVMY